MPMQLLMQFLERALRAMTLDLESNLESLAAGPLERSLAGQGSLQVGRLRQ